MQSGAGKAACTASQRSEENLSQEKPSSDTPLKRNLELPTICPFCQLFLPCPSSASLRLPHLLPLSPAKHSTYRVMFWRYKSSASSLICKLCPPRRQHSANLFSSETLLLEDAIFLSTLAGASFAPPEGLCQPCNPPPPHPQARFERSVSNQLAPDEQRGEGLEAARCPNPSLGSRNLQPPKPAKTPLLSEQVCDYGAVRT